jgi:glycosyltransferase involved in cell wall biosynthesis
MKILLTNFHPYNGGGHTTYILYLFRELNRDNEAFLACPGTSRLYKSASDISKENVLSIDFPGKPREIKDILSNVRRISGIMKEKSFDVIHVNGSPDHKIIMYAKIFFRIKTPVVRTLQNSILPKKNLHTKLRMKFFTNKIIVVSDYQKKQLLANGYREDELTLIRSGIDTDVFTPFHQNEWVRKKYKIDKDDFVFVSVAGTPGYKGWHLLVEAVSQLNSSLRNKIKIIVAGEIPSRKSHLNYVEKFNMTKNVIFPGLLSDVREVIALANVGFVLSYKIETISIACREMMSMGKPVLVSDYAGLPENVDDGVNGWITKTLDVDSIRNRVEEIIRNRRNLDTFSKDARRKAELEFGLSKFISKTFSCYESVVDEY